MVGEMRDFTEAWMQRYFDYLSRGTLAEGGKLEFKRSPAVFRCDRCEGSFTPDLEAAEIACPNCANTRVVLLSGREIRIDSIGVI
jgi:hydrogenase nickel incorporation protein HypA/HybF